jgi:hypothetical protein
MVFMVHAVLRASSPKEKFNFFFVTVIDIKNCGDKDAYNFSMKLNISHTRFSEKLWVWNGVHSAS